MRVPFGLLAALAAFWLVLSGHYTPLLLALGVASVMLVVWLAHRVDLADRQQPVRVGPGIGWYAVWLMAEILKAGLTVSRLVWSPRLTLRPEVGQTPARDISELSSVVYANSITVTPGTLALSVDDEGIEVHSLDPSGLASLRSGAMLREVRRLEAR